MLPAEARHPARSSGARGESTFSRHVMHGAVRIQKPFADSCSDHGDDKWAVWDSSPTGRADDEPSNFVSDKHRTRSISLHDLAHHSYMCS